MAKHIILNERIGAIVPDIWTETWKGPTFNFHHGIGENRTKKTLQQCIDFHSFLDKWADGLAGEKIMFILPQDQDANVATTAQVKEGWLLADKWTDGRKGIGGLSMGAGETLVNALSTLYTTLLFNATCVIPVCPPSWESMNELPVAQSDIPWWAFMGVKDAAVTIASFVNTMGDIIRAGRTKNFNVSIYPDSDHYIWTSVYDKVIPVSPVVGAKDSSGKIITGLKSYTGIADWAMVNDPSIRPMEYFLMQRKGAFKPLPRLSDVQPQPIPEPVPAPTPTPTDVFFRNFIFTPPVFGITWSAGPETIWRLPSGVTIKEMYTAGDPKTDKQYLKVVHSEGSKVFGPKQ